MILKRSFKGLVILLFMALVSSCAEEDPGDGTCLPSILFEETFNSVRHSQNILLATLVSEEDSRLRAATRADDLERIYRLKSDFIKELGSSEQKEVFPNWELFLLRSADKLPQKHRAAYLAYADSLIDKSSGPFDKDQLRLASCLMMDQAIHLCLMHVDS